MLRTLALIVLLSITPAAAQEYEAERLRLVLLAVDSELDDAGRPVVAADEREAVAECAIARLPSRWAELYPDSRLSDRQAFEIVMRGTRTTEEREAMDRLAFVVVEGVSLCASGSAVPIS